MTIQYQVFNWITEKTKRNKKITINRNELDLIKFLEELKIYEFDHKNRNYLFYLFNYVFIEDYFYNIEVFLSIIDKFTVKGQNKETIDIHYVLYYVFSEAYIEKIWNNGKINSKVNVSSEKITFNKIYTLNYDNLTDQIFGDAIHLHGQFDFIANYSKNGKWKCKKIKLSNHEYFSQTFSKRSSVILKGGDYKMDHIGKLASKEINYKYMEYLKQLSNDKSDFLIVGTLVMGDPHILNLILNNENTIYLTYYSEREFHKLQTLLFLLKATKRKSKIYFIKFSKLMKYMNI